MSVWALVAAVALTQAEAPPQTFIGEFPLEDRLEAKIGPSTAVTLTVQIPAGSIPSAELEKRFTLRKLEDAALAFDVRGYPVSKDKVTAKHKAPSFVIDYDEKPVQALRAKFVGSGKEPTIEALTEFVEGAIPKKNLQRGFDFASVVARRGEGDCTEHAVLLAAMARSFGIPARVVMGVALLETRKGLEAFGHAWVEYAAAKNQWLPADAALRGITELQYLPLNVMEDETASFLGATIRSGGVMSIEKIRVEPAAATK